MPQLGDAARSAQLQCAIPQGTSVHYHLCSLRTAAAWPTSLWFWQWPVGNSVWGNFPERNSQSQHPTGSIWQRYPTHPDSPGPWYQQPNGESKGTRRVSRFARAKGVPFGSTALVRHGEQEKSSIQRQILRKLYPSVDSRLLLASYWAGCLRRSASESPGN